MTSSEFRTLAYTKSPKTSKRTTFQDELQAAVSARASKTKTGGSSYSDDFNEDEDEFLEELLKSRKKRTEAFKAGRSKGRINDFDLSDDSSAHGKTKKVSFLKSQRIRSSAEDTDTSESRGNDPQDDSISRNNSYSNPVSPQQKNSGVDSTDSQMTKESTSKSVSHQTSDETLTDMPLPLPSDGTGTETPGSEFPHPSTAESKDLIDVLEKEPPRPKPRQRTLGLSLHASEKPPEEIESKDCSKSQTSSASIPHLTDTSSNNTWSGAYYAESHSLNKYSTTKSEQSQVFTNSIADSGSRDDYISDDSKEKVARYSTSFEEFNEDQSDNSAAQLSQGKSFDIRSSGCQSKATQRSQSVLSRDVESKYLGRLKILDHKVSLQDSQPQGPDSLRAAVYQEWLRKKNEILRENIQQKKKEEILKEKKKRNQETKKEDAAASYTAWKEKKSETLKAKAKEKEEMIRKEQRAIEEKEEKRQSATQVFEKWKQEHDQLLKEKYRKQKESENRLKLKRQENEEERKRESKYAFSDWCDKKKDVVRKKITMERKESKNKAEEERYLKEERDKMALDMYENWLVRKDLEKKRQSEERRVHAILQDSPPPPWSPPNKTIPFGK